MPARRTPAQPEELRAPLQQLSLNGDNVPPRRSPMEPPNPETAKMLIFFPNGDQRLITFTLPKESCTLQEVMEQMNIPCTGDTHMQCMRTDDSEIDFFVAIDSHARIEDLIKNHPLLLNRDDENEHTESIPENRTHA